MKLNKWIRKREKKKNEKQNHNKILEAFQTLVPEKALSK